MSPTSEQIVYSEDNSGKGEDNPGQVSSSAGNIFGKESFDLMI